MDFTGKEMIEIINKIKYARAFGRTLGKFGIIQWHLGESLYKNLIRGIGLKEAKEYVERLREKCLLPEQQQTETIILVDDERNIEADVVCRSYEDGYNRLLHDGPFGTLYLDHDLASYDKDGKEKTGYDLISWLEQCPQYAPRKIVCVSANPVGRKRIEQVIDNIYRRRRCK